MQFLADEGCDFNFVRALRAAGHDVRAVTEIALRADDPEVIRLATEQSRVLLTEDKDFGQLVFASGAPSAGVVLFRYPTAARQVVIEDFVRFAQEKGEQLRDCFTVFEPGRVRLKPRPDLGSASSDRAEPPP
jgi:predicted nuclease of predicted toxin-antitoxin system